MQFHINYFCSKNFCVWTYLRKIFLNKVLRTKIFSQWKKLLISICSDAIGINIEFCGVWMQSCHVNLKVHGGCEMEYLVLQNALFSKWELLTWPSSAWNISGMVSCIKNQTHHHNLHTSASLMVYITQFQHFAFNGWFLQILTHIYKWKNSLGLTLLIHQAKDRIFD